MRPSPTKGFNTDQGLTHRQALIARSDTSKWLHFLPSLTLCPKSWFCLLMMLPLWGQAQFTEVYTLGGNGNDNGQQLLAAPDGSFYLGGTIDSGFSPLEEALPLYGEEDLFFGRVDASGNWIWAASAGSFLTDELKAMAFMPDGGLLLAGTFWLEFEYGNQLLTATDNIKGIFIMHLDAAGNWQWGKVINGSDLKELTDVQVAEDGTIFLSGHFSESLFFDDLELEASGENDAYLLKLDDSGRFIDWHQVGTQGTTRGQTLALRPDGGYYWGGIYNDTLLFDTAQLLANTFDPDLFLIRYQPDGTPLWIRKAGGVFEVDLTDMTTDAEGQLLATGSFFGVVTFSEDISIQSRNGNLDIFLFKYGEDGAPIWARAVGGNSIDQAATLILRDDELIIGGRYQEMMAWDDLSAPFTEGVSGFVASFDQANGSGNWLYALLADEFTFVEDLVQTEQGRLFALGSFRGDTQLGNRSISSPGQYDIFLTGITPDITPTFQPDETITMRLYPNPTSGIAYLTRDEGQLGFIEIYDSNGKLLQGMISRQTPERIDLSAYSPGVYWLVVRQGGRHQWKRVIRK